VSRSDVLGLALSEIDRDFKTQTLLRVTDPRFVRLSIT
jgi:hypothetical protein